MAHQGHGEAEGLAQFNEQRCLGDMFFLTPGQHERFTAELAQAQAEAEEQARESASPGDCRPYLLHPPAGIRGA